MSDHFTGRGVPAPEHRNPRQWPLVRHQHKVPADKARSRGLRRGRSRSHWAASWPVSAAPIALRLRPLTPSEREAKLISQTCSCLIVHDNATNRAFKHTIPPGLDDSRLIQLALYKEAMVSIMADTRHP